MLRIWTYVNLDVNGDPTSAGTYFDPVVYNLRSRMGQNILAQGLRDGTEIIIDDPQSNFPMRVNLTLHMSEIDLKSEVQFAGRDRYLGPVLYLHKAEKMWIVLYHQSSQATSPKCYLCRILSLDEAVAGIATIDTSDMTYSPSMEPQNASMQLELYIDRDGIFTDYDDVSSGVYAERIPAS